MLSLFVCLVPAAQGYGYGTECECGLLGSAVVGGAGPHVMTEQVQLENVTM